LLRVIRTRVEHERCRRNESNWSPWHATRVVHGGNQLAVLIIASNENRETCWNSIEEVIKI